MGEAEQHGGVQMRQLVDVVSEALGGQIASRPSTPAEHILAFDAALYSAAERVTAAAASIGEGSWPPLELYASEGEEAVDEPLVPATWWTQDCIKEQLALLRDAVLPPLEELPPGWPSLFPHVRNYKGSSVHVFRVRAVKHDSQRMSMWACEFDMQRRIEVIRKLWCRTLGRRCAAVSGGASQHQIADCAGHSLALAPGTGGGIPLPAGTPGARFGCDVAQC